jgi:signal transduction histidine kinase
MAMFAASFLIFGAFIFFQTSSFLERELRAQVDVVLTEAATIFEASGALGLQAEIEQRVASDPQGEGLYLLVGLDCVPIAGSLNRLPLDELDSRDCARLLTDDGWFDFEVDRRVTGFANRDEDEQDDFVFARLVALSDEYAFMYGRIAGEAEILVEVILGAMFSGFLIILALALGSSFLMSRAVTTRLERLNRTSQEIREGNLSSRMPTDGTSDEFDRLAGNLNGMLDQIELLMQGVKEVSNAIAHDLRTPLTRLRNDLEQLRAAPPGAEHDEQVEEAIGEADKLLNIFSALLRIVQIESGARRQDFGSTNLGHIVTDVVEFYEPLAVEKSLALSADIQVQLSIRGDQDLISQALSNLISNAVKYTPEDGTVVVSLSEGASGPRLVVADSGPGIPLDKHEKVLARFYRLDMHRESEGSGLGLSLVAAVAKLHRATITLEDNKPGLRVVIEFPSQDDYLSF